MTTDDRLAAERRHAVEKILMQKRIDQLEKDFAGLKEAAIGKDGGNGFRREFRDALGHLGVRMNTLESDVRSGFEKVSADIQNMDANRAAALEDLKKARQLDWDRSRTAAEAQSEKMWSLKKAAITRAIDIGLTALGVVILLGLMTYFGAKP